MKIVYLLPLSLPSTRHVGDIVYLKKRVGSCGFCLLPQTFGKVEVQGAMFFFYIETIPRDCDRQRPTKITVEGIMHQDPYPLPNHCCFLPSTYSADLSLPLDFRCFDHRVHTEWRLPISGVHPLMMEKSALAGESGDARPTPCSLLP